MEDAFGWEWFMKHFEGLSSIDLTAYKRPQMERRINSFMRSVNACDYKNFLDLLRKDKQICRRFIEHLTINVSEFFRNPSQWEILERQIIPELYRRQKSLRIWSAGCSTGEEVYSLAMLFKEKFASRIDRILASDLDSDVLARASEGLYSSRAAETLPDPYRTRYLVQEGENFRIRDEVKNMVRFTKHDLLKEPFERNFDLILCRNVVIYFTEESKQKLYYKFADALKTGGVLFIGSTEQIFQAREIGLKSIATFFYQKQ